MTRYHCPDHPPPTLQAAINLFNAGAYYECHELLEALWLDETDPLRDLYKGVLQIGIGLLHRRRGNLKGARRLLDSGARLLEPFPADCFGLDLLRLRTESDALRRRLQMEDPHPDTAPIQVHRR